MKGQSWPEGQSPGFLSLRALSLSGVMQGADLRGHQQVSVLVGWILTGHREHDITGMDKK